MTLFRECMSRHQIKKQQCTSMFADFASLDNGDAAAPREGAPTLCACGCVGSVLKLFKLEFEMLVDRVLIAWAAPSWMWFVSQCGIQTG